MKLLGILVINLDVIEISGLRAAFTSSQFGVMVAVGNPGRHVLELGSSLLLSPALAYARRLAINTVYIGYTKLDADYSAEYTQVFLDVFSDLSKVAGYPPISFQAPFVDKSKADVIRLGAKHEKLLAAAWTCHLQGPHHCGICESCEGRRAAFKEAKVKDVTTYDA